MKPKLDIGLFVDLAEFICFYQIKTKQFYDQVMQELVQNREIQLDQQTIRCQVLAYLNNIWIRLIIKL